jgi:peptidoglycan/LPS O-acetylase OafA/YrhL
MQNKTLDDADLSDRFVAIADRKMDGGQVYDYALEGLRGLAAIWVAYAHIFFFEFNLDPAYHPAFPFGTFLNAAHGGILIFFALSGYVIGLTNQLPFSRSNAIRYLLRRFIRLYPIYVVAIALGMLSSAAGSWKTIVGSLFFLPPVKAGLLPGNGVLWTLHYEVVYYIIFLAIWYFRPKVLPLMITTLIVSCIPIIFPSSPLIFRMVSGYAAGWVFWLFGLWLAWKKPRSKNTIKFPLFSYILLYITTDKLATGVVVLKDLGLVTTKLSEISITDFVYFPLCILLFASLTQRKLPHLCWWMMVAIAIPLGHAMYLLVSGKLIGNEAQLIAVAHMILGFALLPWKISPGIFIYLDFFGSISYGIYVFHMPILNFMNKLSLFSGSPITFIIRALMWAGLTIGISYLLELKIQPLTKKWFQEKVINRIKLIS